MTRTLHLRLPWGGGDLWCIVAIAAAVLIVAAPGITTGGLGWSDAPSHTFDGIFVLEFFKEWMTTSRPVLEPDASRLVPEPETVRQWAERFYLRHPALGMIVYWPPGFAAVEAAVFAVFGISVVTARATVLLFAVGAGVLMFRLGKRWFDRPTGLFAAMLLITCPHGALWLNDVMLEWPATFWLLAAVGAYQKHLDTRKTRWSVLLAMAVTMAFLTKQTAAFIGPVLFLCALFHKDRRRQVLRPAFLVSLSLAAAFIVGYALLTRDLTALSSQLLRPSPDVAFYARHLPEVVGWPLLPIVVLGLATFVAAPNRGPRGLLLLWFVAWTAFCCVISAKEPRYFFFALPPLAFAGVRFFTRAGRGGDGERRLCWKHDAGRFVLLAALVLTQTLLVRVGSTGRLPTYAAAVAELAGRPDADLVLIDAVRDGQFVFDLYQDPATRERIIPLRASKLLYARAARMTYFPKLLVETEQEIIDLLDKYGICYIVIESALPRTHDLDADPPPRKHLRHLLTTDPRFTLVKSWSLACDDPIWDDVDLRLYVYNECPPRTSKTITLPFPAMGREISFRLP